MPSYPSNNPCAGVRVSAVFEESPFDDIGVTPGCVILRVNGAPVRDVIDWRWLTGGEEEICVSLIDTEGDAADVIVERDEDEPWGIEFEGLVFDNVKTCRNACTFCFMRQLPSGMRPSLSMRDDDFRLSFLVGTFVTLTNITPEDEARIVSQRLSPLRFSLHAHDERVRTRLIGAHAHHGLSVFSRLAAAGIEFDTQIVLVPGENDGAVLDDTLAWAAHQRAIKTVGVVPLGYTSHQRRFSHSFEDPASAHAVLAQLEKANALRDEPWVFAADEFYLNAFGDAALGHLPSAAHYGEFEMFEDGIGMTRSFLEEWKRAHASGLAAQVAARMGERNVRARYVFGEAMRPVMDALLCESPLRDVFVPTYVRNAYFGGNVTVTGLLTAQDILATLTLSNGEYAECAPREGSISQPSPTTQDIVLIPRVVFNDDGVTLDDSSAADLEAAASRPVHVVSCNPMQFLSELIDIVLDSRD